ncbi:MAG: serine/threonine-protein kinase [Ignavibacteriales bacterium]|nr:serine/threonine-protein kinase [Ignavibacteriales bacterium]
MINKIISHYKIISQLGQGGMGVLYLAEDLELNRKAVLKFLPPELINDPEINLRFKREAQSAGSLSHPNIVTIYDVGVHENKTFMAMEYVEGKTLRELIKSDELTIERITDISVQTCEGLNEAHSKGITHRDIKPENILIDEKGKVKIVDFGLAKIKNVSRGITKQDSTVGTLKYMSPEQIRNQNVDHRSDIWSFGVILYEMITGKYPFKGEHDASLFYSIINQLPEPLARFKTDISEGFQRIIDKSLDKDPETRYQHIDEVLSDLRREKKESGEHRVDKRRTKKSKTKIAIIVSAIALAVLCTSLAIYILNNQAKKMTPPKHTQLTFDGNIYFFNNGRLYERSLISPNGQFTAYVSGEGSGKSIYVKDNSGEQAIEIFKGINSVTTLRWSPSSNEIFFTAGFNNSLYSSYIISKFGGNVQQLKTVQYACWSPDESFIAVVPSVSTKILRIIKRETDEVVKTLQLTGTFTWLVDIDWSPNGDKILFHTSDNFSGKDQIWTINTDGLQQQKILDETKIIYSPRWSADGNHIYYLQENKMTQDLMKIESSQVSSDKESQVVQTGLLAYGFSITSNNKKLCYTKYSVSSNLWNFIYNGKTNIFNSNKLTAGTNFYSGAVISPNGRDIAFAHKGNIFKMSVDGDFVEQLTFLNSECYSPSWSPDGKEVTFISGLNLAKVSSEGGTPTIFKNTIVGARASWLSDLEILYNKSGNRNFHIFNPVTQENKLFVSNDSVGWMFQPCLSPDNLSIAIYWNRYPPSVARGLWLISRKDSSQKLLLQGMIYPLRWSNDSQGVYVINSTKTPPEILIVFVNTGLTNLIYTLPTNEIGYNDIDISSDGKTIVCAIEETNSDVWMIENFDPDVE